MIELLTQNLIWWLPLAGLPILIHLLNRLRYQSVSWAAMMFLRLADRESTRRARIRQWWILAMRTLVLLLFLFALLRPLYQGALARFLNTGAEMVVIVFDRSASMEMTTAGRSARSRSISLLQDALVDTGDHARVLLLDSVSLELLPIGKKTDLSLLPRTAASSTAADMQEVLGVALDAVDAQAVEQSEIWIATDLQAANWNLGATEAPALPAGLEDRVAVRLIDVGDVAQGNRSLQLNGEPRRRGNTLRVPLALSRSGVATAESLPILVDREGSRIRTDVNLDGGRFEWEQTFAVAPSETFTASLSIPDDANPVDNVLYLAIPPASLRRADIACASPGLEAIVRAGLLPRDGICAVNVAVDAQEAPASDVSLRIQDAAPVFSDAWTDWLAEGGILLLLPGSVQGGSLDWAEIRGDEAFALSEWNESAGPFRLGTGQQPLRLDLLNVAKREALEAGGVLGKAEVLAAHVDGIPFLLREIVENGAVYQLSTLPFREWSSFGDGYLWVPFLQRLLEEGRGSDLSQGTHALGEWLADAREAPWRNAEGRDPANDAGLYSRQGRWLALNTPEGERDPARLSVAELQEFYAPLSVRVFRDDTLSDPGEAPSRVELAPWLVLAALIFVLVESLLLLKSMQRHRRPLSAGGGR